MKKYIVKISFALIGGLSLGIIGGLKFINYGAADCDMPGRSCDCFCCNSFGLRGYEACGNFGLFGGFGLGLIIGLFIYWLINNKSK